MSIKVALEGWMVESGEGPSPALGEVLSLSLGAAVRAIDGVGAIPANARLDEDDFRDEIDGLVEWSHVGPHGLRLVCRHQGVPIAASAANARGPRQRPSLLARLRGARAGIPSFPPVDLPRPAVGQPVRLRCALHVLAAYELEEMWPGPSVEARYRVDRIDAEIIRPVPLPEGIDEFDELPKPPRRLVRDLPSTWPPPQVEPFDTTHDGGFTGEDLEVYHLLLTPVLA